MAAVNVVVDLDLLEAASPTWTSKSSLLEALQSPGVVEEIPVEESKSRLGPLLNAVFPSVSSQDKRRLYAQMKTVGWLQTQPEKLPNLPQVNVLFLERGKNNPLEAFFYGRTRGAPVTNPKVLQVVENAVHAFNRSVVRSAAVSARNKCAGKHFGHAAPEE